MNNSSNFTNNKEVGGDIQWKITTTRTTITTEITTTTITTITTEIIITIITTEITTTIITIITTTDSNFDLGIFLLSKMSTER